MFFAYTEPGGLRMSPENSRPSARRSFLGTLAGGAVALGAAPLLASCAAPAPVASAPADEESWIKPLTGKHKQVFDAPAVNSGFPLIFAYVYLETMTKAYNLKAGEANAVVVVRHFGIPMALSDSIWAKYKLGEMMKLTDPATKKPSVRNYFYKSKEGDLMAPDASADKLIARGVVIAVCNIALQKVSEMAAKGAGVKPEDALKEWTAGLIPGAFVVPSGVLAVGRTQEKGCTYCFAG
jgi:intracellular sulfur oxidation DsrE/DsrF family protein